LTQGDNQISQRTVVEDCESSEHCSNQDKRAPARVQEITTGTDS